ncbi:MULTISPECIES: hypothetical protein [Acinetobacter]|uniref:Lipoprotein n=1 Tax=Acinetobacter towneri TaxID=202956 RepID=A0AAP9GUB4_9GAMM|nr:MULTISPECIES: hypothetical protein [Acinetobacter]MDM1736885.1 hypothetical protein [Acinetobacter towneri]QGM27025.1 hypothetical protein GJD93_04685 [Acinetobacter towneri]QTD65021.1 hypothetical protein J4G46_04215 [Acinetobacter towneri]WPC31460.1 hypothetical protein O4J62_09640 [Acinetobacter towneri]
MKRAISLILSCVVFTGCATSSKNLTASYVSPLQYQQYSCDQLGQEASNIQNRVAEIGGSVDSRATRDKWVTGAGLVLFWPALFFIGGNKAQEAEFSRLKGEYEAVQKMAVQKNCLTSPASK